MDMVSDTKESRESEDKMLILKLIMVILPDTGERYLSSLLLLEV